ncbi:MAG TPA: choline/ethanolamine kinase family protein [Dongiaceae bacterium]|nr:choline/ethanolamine kinase family protein [Dongiaceae bacterium]
MTRINIPAARDEQAMIAVIRQIPSLPQGSGGWTIRALPSFTNRIFRIARGGEAFTLRLPGRGTERYIDRTAEAANARAANAIGLGAEIIFADPASGIMVTRFIEDAVALSAAALKDNASLHATVGLLRRLHDSGLAFQGQMNLYPKMDEYLSLAPAPALLALRREGEKLRPVLEPGWGPPRPCHIDPAPHNFITAAGRRYLLDWEYSAMCEPLWDLAGLSIEGEFDTRQDRQMLAAYFGREEGAWPSRLHLYKIMLRLLAASWGAVQLADGNGPPEIADMVLRLENQARAGLSDPGIAHHIAAA